MNLYTKQKQTHGQRECAYGCQAGGFGRDAVGGLADVSFYI